MRLDGSGGMEFLKQPPRELRAWIVSKRVDRVGEGVKDPTTIGPFKADPF